MNRVKASLSVLLASAVLLPAAGEPGSSVYGATVEKGESEAELIYGLFHGGEEDGGWGLVAELNHGVTEWWRTEIQFEFEREPEEDAVLEGVEFENVFAFNATRDWPVRLGAAVAYEFGLRDEPDGVEAMLIAEHASGPLSVRGNFITTRGIGDDADDTFAFGYAAQLLYGLGDEVSLGLEGYGDAGTEDAFAEFDEAAHYWGPVAQLELPGAAGAEPALQLGYLAAFGEAEADGYFQMVLELEY